jgi:hypothetical protein
VQQLFSGKLENFILNDFSVASTSKYKTLSDAEFENFMHKFPRLVGFSCNSYAINFTMGAMSLF